MPFIVGCGQPSNRSIGRDGGSSQNKISENKEGINVNKPVIIPPGYNERPDINNPLDPNNPDVAFSKNLKGINLETLFLKDINDTDKRFKRLEDAFIAFRHEYEDIRPAIMRLTAIEADIQALVGDLEVLMQSGDVLPLSKAAPIESIAEKDTFTVSEPEALLKEDIKTPHTISPDSEEGQTAEPANTKPISDNTHVQAIRIGIHPEKERIVIELRDKITYTVDLDNQEKVLTVHFSGLENSLALSDYADLNSHVISSYRFSESSEGIDLLFQLKKPTKILATEWLNATTGFPSQRLVIDLKN